MYKTAFQRQVSFRSNSKIPNFHRISQNNLIHCPIHQKLELIHTQSPAKNKNYQTEGNSKLLGRVILATSSDRACRRSFQALLQENRRIIAFRGVQTSLSLSRDLASNLLTHHLQHRIAGWAARFSLSLLRRASLIKPRASCVMWQVGLRQPGSLICRAEKATVNPYANGYCAPYELPASVYMCDSGVICTRWGTWETRGLVDDFAWLMRLSAGYARRAC